MWWESSEEQRRGVVAEQGSGRQGAQHTGTGDPAQCHPAHLVHSGHRESSAHAEEKLWKAAGLPFRESGDFSYQLSKGPLYACKCGKREPHTQYNTAGAGKLRPQVAHITPF